MQVMNLRSYFQKKQRVTRHLFDDDTELSVKNIGFTQHGNIVANTVEKTKDYINLDEYEQAMAV